MNILVVNHHDRLSPRVQQEVETLRARGYGVSIIHWVRDQRRTSEQWDAKVDYLYTRSTRLPSAIGFVLSLPFIYKQIVQYVGAHNAAVLHCTHLLLLPPCVWIRRLKDVKIVYDAYERYAINIAARVPVFKSMVRFIAEFFEDFLVRRCDAVLTTDSAQGFLASRYRKQCPAVYEIANFPWKENSGISQSDIISSRHSSKKYSVIYVGGITQSRGVSISIEAFGEAIKRVPELKLVLIGKFQSKAYEHEIVRRVQNMEISDNVRIVNWKPYREMMQYVQEADIGLALYQPTYKHQFVGMSTARKLFTYMQAATPVVASNIGSIADVVETERCGILVDPSDVEAVSNAIVYLLENPQIARAMGERGQKAVDEKYNWEMEQQKLVDAYRTILS